MRSSHVMSLLSCLFVTHIDPFIHRDTVRGPNPTSGLVEIQWKRYPCPNNRTVQDAKASMSRLTVLLGQIRGGDAEARAALFAAAYPELHRMARARLRDGGRSVVLDTTGLVHESYLRFVRVGELRVEDRRAFFAYASQVMRSVIVNSVRERIAQKRGGSAQPLTLSTQLGATVADGEESIMKVHEALEELAKVEPRMAQVVEMRYFGGYSEREMAETLGVTERTVERDWEKARLILAAALE